MRKFKCEVVTTNTYIVEIDENIINEEWMENFSEYFFDCKTVEAHAENLAIQRSRLVSRDDTFIEGYGKVRVKVDGFDTKDYEKVEDGITIKVIEEDEEIEAEVREIK
ncbi:hypothetical protein F4V43_02095 [Paenibacillus spiritus]|uniref:Uncharacterized protein n=1 Tax=Paenibacillus spiritus TaxID=2496557 RepID=A0A5J5GH14_9BACL|nr:hypothetical protein [Paenibacillus spiritus]KAA9007300.1 hypothetical protein F4V43_02095 [Paenibacillus spiritus]